MNKKFLIIIIVAVVLLISNGIFIYLYMNKDKSPQATDKAELYVCPMHPQIQSDHPGICPICHMELVLKSTKDSLSTPTAAGEVTLSPAQQVLANVKTEIASYETFGFSIEANGVVKQRDDAVRQISSPVKGKITKLYINYEGQKVSSGQKAFELYSPELIATQKEYLLAYENYLKAQESTNAGIKESASAVLNAAKQRLSLWFVDETEINELMQTKQVKNSLTYYSDFGGVVTKKYFNEGSWVMEGATILDIVNLSSVWVMANIYESDLSRISIGQSAMIYVNDKTIRGKIDYITPYVNPDTRTIEVRITISNPGLYFKPEMFVKVKIETGVSMHSIVLPRTAVLRTGKMDMVYVKKSGNVFAPKMVEISGEQNDKYLIKSGIEEGEEVVVSAGFLLDSESQIRSGSGSSMPGMDMPGDKKDMQIKEGDALKDTKQHQH